MTREEAIKNIKEHCYFANLIPQAKEALDIAIKALEQEPCEDCISRLWLKEAIHNFYYGLKHTPTEEDIQAYIDVAPSVTPQPKMGRWLEHPEIKTSTPEYLMFYECSECGDKQCFYKPDLHKKRFCNNCGARMAESEE